MGIQGKYSTIKQRPKPCIGIVDTLKRLIEFLLVFYIMLACDILPLSIVSLSK